MDEEKAVADALQEIVRLAQLVKRLSDDGSWGLVQAGAVNGYTDMIGHAAAQAGVELGVLVPEVDHA